jgi:hypothetical protein
MFKYQVSWSAWRALRIVVAGSWLIYITELALSIPIPREGFVPLLLGIFASMFGVGAVVAATFTSSRWRVFASTAACVYLVTYCVRMALLTLDEAETWGGSFPETLGRAYRSSWQIFAHFYETFGVTEAVSYAFTAFLMPVLQLGIATLLIMGANPSMHRTGNSKAVAGQ